MENKSGQTDFFAEIVCLIEMKLLLRNVYKPFDLVLHILIKKQK